MEEIRVAANASVGIARRRSKFPTLLAGADISVLLRQESLDPLEGKIRFDPQLHILRAGRRGRSAESQYGWPPCVECGLV